jgi:hypothetical protein
MSEVRRSYGGVLMGGVDEIRFQDLTPDQMRRQIDAARAGAGAKWIAAPGCKEIRS